MPAAERTIGIRRPADEVHRFLEDVRTATQWRSSADYEITALGPDGRIAIRAIAGPVRPLGEFTLEAVGDATILTLRLWLELPWWKQLLFGRAVQQAMDAEVAALDRLRDVLER